MKETYIFDALRTPRGKGKPAVDGRGGGSLSGIAPYELVAKLIGGLEERNPGMSHAVDSLTLGCVGQVKAQGGHIGLVSRLASSLSDKVAVNTINNYCISGLIAVMNAALWSKQSGGRLFLGGGVESLSHVGFLADKADYNLKPDLVAKLQWAPPIMGAELIASLEGYEKSELDELTARSHQRAHQAWEDGRYDTSVMPIKDDQGEVLLAHDELVRSKLSIECLAGMPPAFAEQGAQGFDAMMLEAFPELDEISHVHSIANCPGLADGACLVLVGDEDAGHQNNLEPMARITGFEHNSDDPVLQFSAGFKAVETLLAKLDMTLDDMDLIECFEAFAAVPLKFERDYRVEIDKLNVNGGHLAMGHPMGASGAILLTTLVHELIRRGLHRGLVVTHAGSGIGAAMVVETV